MLFRQAFYHQTTILTPKEEPQVFGCGCGCGGDGTGREHEEGKSSEHDGTSGLRLGEWPLEFCNIMLSQEKLLEKADPSQPSLTRSGEGSARMRSEWRKRAFQEGLEPTWGM